MATEFRTRPSKFVGIDDEWAAYQFDYHVLAMVRADEKDTSQAKKYADWRGIAK